MKNPGTFLLAAALFLCSCKAEKQQYQTSENTSFSAIVTSDLHYTNNPDHNNPIVPLISDVKEGTQAIVQEVIAKNPDVFIVTGDLTNSGLAEDEKALSSLLQPVKDAGIQVVLTPGNHDFIQGTLSSYQETFGPLLSQDEKDPASASYVTRIKDVSLFAMDDSSCTNGKHGEFSKETMKWLKKMLKQETDAGQKVLFLSHYSPLDQDEIHDKSYTIQNKELPSLLKKYHVRLICAGHQHAQNIIETDTVNEIISAIPWTGKHWLGNLSITGNSAVYHAETIDFRTYGSIFLEKDVEAADAKEKQYQDQLFDSVFPEDTYDSDVRFSCKNLWDTFWTSYAEGTLQQKAAGILSDPAYPVFINGLMTTNYGPWIKVLLHHPPHDSTTLSFSWD